MRSASPRSRPVALTLLLVSALLVPATGCKSVATGPFSDFSSSLQPLRAGTDAEAGSAADASRQELVAKVAAGEVSPADLQLEFDPSDPFTTTYGFAQNEPDFVKLLRFRQGLSSLNDAMIGYAQSLVVLAGGGQGGDIVPTTAQFDQMARDLNANAGSAAAALGVKIAPGRQALLSTAAVELFKAYIESKRRRALAQAIREVQPNVEEFAGAAQQAVDFLASLVQTGYDRQILPLATASPPDATPILTLNDATQARLATLRSLSKSYAALPAAHRDLAAAAAERKTGLAGLIALSDEATRLQGLVTELAKANAAAAAGATNP